VDDTPNLDSLRNRPRGGIRPIGAMLVAAAVSLQAGNFAIAQPADNTQIIGRVEGGSDVLSLGTSATGTVAEMLVGTGDRVHAGQQLIRIECGNIERELEARRGDLAAAEAVFARVVHGPRPEEVTIGVANVNLADARLHEAEKAYQRTQQLHEGFTVTRVQIEQAQRDARIAAAMLDEVRAKLALLKAGSREEDITEARGRRDAAKERVEEAEKRLGYCAIRSPIDGVVLSTHISLGQLVSTTVPVTLLTIVDDSRRRVRAFVDERDVDVGKVCARQRARIAADGVTALAADAVVESTSSAVVDNPFTGNGSRQFRQVMLSVADNQPLMPIGLRVTVALSPCTPQRGGAK
jgi:HlyD family secretion protein